VEAVLRFLRSQGFREIFLVALSMGGYMAIRTLGARPQDWPEVRALAVVSAPSRWSKVYPRLDLRIPFKVRLPPREKAWRPRVRLTSFFGARQEAAEVVGRLPCPLQIHHHRADWLIRFSHGEELAREAQQDREFLIYQDDGNFDHADTLVRRRFQEVMGRLEGFLCRHGFRTISAS
jgi:pimeloyl-ACP methyl ester carboxylesterase